MNITPQCVSCIFNQALRVTKELRLPEQKAKEVLDLASSFVPRFSMEQNPPVNATMMYEAIAQHLGMEDIYAEVKAHSTAEAQRLVPYCEELLAQSVDLFVDATKVAIAGNVIDLAAEVKYDIEEELRKLIHTPLAIDDTATLRTSLENAKNVVYLADNAGEHIFDRIYIRHLRELFPQIRIAYFVRGNPIINDVTYAEAEAAGIGDYATIIDSRAPTPCIMAESLEGEAKELFENADTIISKGMGNYECLSGQASRPIFFLLKVKCSVVSDSIGQPMGSIVCKRIGK